MIPKVLIIVEGIADIIFIQNYLIFLENNLNADSDRLKKDGLLVLSNNNVKIEILKLEGYTGIATVKTKIQGYLDNKYTIITIQDADNPNTPDGGFKKRKKYFKDIQEKHNIKFKTFLFPNHEDDGDLETLLLRIKNTEMYNLQNECYEKYITCLEKISKRVFTSELRTDKAKVFNYFQIYYGMEQAKERNRSYELKYWDLEHKELDPLKKLLNSFLLLKL